jgi:hypothetical protein
MKTLWQFGDSYTAPHNPKNWGYKLSKKLQYESFEQRGQLGHSNYQIITDIISEIDNIKEEDGVIVNWSYLSRGIIVTKVEDLEANILSTNRLFNDEKKVHQHLDNLEEGEIPILEKFIQLIDVFTKNNINFNPPIFYQFKIIQNILQKRGVRVYSVFLEKDYLTDFGKNIEWPLDNFGLNTIEFKDGYENFLRENDYLGTSDLDHHYKCSISDTIAEHFYKRIKIL